MKDKLLILNLEDSRLDAELNQAALADDGIDSEIIRVDTRENFQAALADDGIDIILADYTLPAFNGLSALIMARQVRPDTPFIFVTGTLGEEVAIDALKHGATDYILKSRLSRLGPAVRRAMQERETIRERKKAEEALLIKNHAIESSISAIAIFDLSGYLTYVNPSFLKIWGYQNAAAVLNRPLALFFNNREETGQLLAVLEHDRGWVGELAARRQNGNIFDAQVLATLVRDDRGHPLCGMASLLDISEGKQMEARLRQAQKMEAIGTLAGGIAHDFNNILGAIFGYTEMGIESLGPDDPLARDFKQILKAANRAKDLVNQILTFSRRQEQQARPVRLSSILKETLKLLRATLPTTIDLRWAISPEAKKSAILADPTELHQILMNLCTNAAYAMRDKGGMLAVCLADVNLDAEFVASRTELTPGPHLRLSVADTGPGMTEDIRQRIFEPYFTTKPIGEGTGLGLATVYGIVKSCHGAISVHSQPDKGTEFQIFLPILADQPAGTLESTAALPTGQGHVLLVDDEESLTEVGRKMLNFLGYQVSTKNRSLEALEAFRAAPERFDLVIADQTMPKMTGFGLAREILAIRADIPIILCSGSSEAIDRQAAMALGVRGFLLKPILIKELAKAVGELLSKAR